MSNFIDWTFHWLLDHPYQTCFYILALAASIFGRDVRAFLSIPPQKLSIWVLKSRLQSAIRKLEELSRCHQNVYFLTLHIWRSTVHFLLALTPFIFLVGLHTAIILRALDTRKAFTVGEFRVFVLLAGYSLTLSGFELFRLAFFINQLSNFSEYEPRLSNKILRFQSKLAKTEVALTEDA